MGITIAIDARVHGPCRVIGDRVLQLFLNHALRDGYCQCRHASGSLRSQPETGYHRLLIRIMGQHRTRIQPPRYAESCFGFIPQRLQNRVWQECTSSGLCACRPKTVDEFSPVPARRWGSLFSGMDATRISMARLLTYSVSRSPNAFETWGDADRADFLLQPATMVVVAKEGPPVRRQNRRHIKTFWGKVGRTRIRAAFTSSKFPIGPRARLIKRPEARTRCGYLLSRGPPPCFFRGQPPPGREVCFALRPKCV